jgi:hypothetical protein
MAIAYVLSTPEASSEPLLAMGMEVALNESSAVLLLFPLRSVLNYR